MVRRVQQAVALGIMRQSIACATTQCSGANGLQHAAEAVHTSLLQPSMTYLRLHLCSEDRRHKHPANLEAVCGSGGLTKPRQNRWPDCATLQEAKSTVSQADQHRVVGANS